MHVDMLPLGGRTVAVVIPNLNGLRHLPRCLASVTRECASLGNAAKVIVVDNGSTDGSQRFIQQTYPTVDVLALRTNEGFAGACDEGVRNAWARYCLLLNNDAWFAPGSLAALVDGAERAQYAIAGPTILNPDGSFQSASVPVDFLGDPPLLGDDAQTRRIPFYFSGAALLVRRADYLELGGLDRRFFMLFEETDFQWRAHLWGKRIGHVASAKVFHVGGGTAPGADLRPGKATVVDWNRLYFARRNNLAMLLKNYALRNLLWVLPLWTLSALVECAGMLIVGHGEQVSAYVAAILWNLRHLPGTIRRRRVVQAGRRLNDGQLRPLLAPHFTRLRVLIGLARMGTRVKIQRASGAAERIH